MVFIPSNMPIEILGFISAVCVALIVLGYIYRTSFPMSFIWFLTGAILILIFVTTDTIGIGNTPAYSVVEEPLLLSSTVIPATPDSNVTITRAVQNVGNVNQNICGTSGCGGSRTVGEKITASGELIGEDIDTIMLTLNKVGSPTGTATIGIDNTGDTIPDISFGTKDVSTLTTTFTDYNFTSASDHTIASNNYIIIRYTGGDASNYIRTQVSSTDVYDGVNSVKTSTTATGSTYVDTTTSDLKFTLYDTVQVEGTPEVTVYDYNDSDNTIHDYPAGNLTYPIKVFDNDTQTYSLEPNFIGMMLIVLAMAFIMVGILIERT